MGKKKKRVPLLELNLNNHHRNVTSLKKQTDFKLEERAGITDVQSTRIRMTFLVLGHKQGGEK